jgi:two-component system, OmpR family, sensor histidine kinase KdpD
MQRGVLRVYLGAAPGVGKTVAMLTEGTRRQQRNARVVIGAVETHGRAYTTTAMGGLTTTSPLVGNAGMDLDRILAAAPEVVLVDDFAAMNRPGAKYPRRWQEVQVLLDAGADVVTTLNIDQLESLADTVGQITGTVPTQTLPDTVAQAADQIELVDISPEALRRRMAHGSIYPPERVDAALANYFRPGTLGALRELALLWLVEHVEESLRRYQTEQHIAGTWETRERIVVAMTGGPDGERLIRRASRLASRLRGDLLGVHVVRSKPGHASSGGLQRHRDLLSEIGGTYREVVDDDVAGALVRFAVGQRATQLVIGSGREVRRWRARPSLLQALAVLSDAVDIHVVPTSGAHEAQPLATLHRQRRRTKRRSLSAWTLCVGGLVALTVVLTHLRSSVELPAVFLLYLSLTLAVAAVGGRRVGLVASLAGFTVTNWFFIPPRHSLSIARPEDVIALVVFIVVAGFVAELVERTAQQSRESLRARSEAAALARSSATLVGAADPLPELVDQLRVTFGLAGVSVLERSGTDWMTHTSSGIDALHRPEEGMAFDLGAAGDAQLVITGQALASQDLHVLRAFADQLSVALQRRHLRADAEAAEALAGADGLRTALLRAVSHDLRTPLASTKAAVTSLLQRDIRWSELDTESLLRTIDESVDRLDRLVGDLLDMSRLQAGAVQLANRPTALEDVVAAALQTTPGSAGRVMVNVPETLPLLDTDPALLERVVANIVSNALAWSPDGQSVRLEAAQIGQRIHLRVIDQGPGLGRADRARMFEPFQRYGDHSNDAGVGLGLAVARGFTEALGATLIVDDTPGGGLTMTIDLPSPTQ